jgi:hypothetical protein
MYDKALISQGFVVSGVLENFRLAGCVPSLGGQRGSADAAENVRGALWTID